MPIDPWSCVALSSPLWEDQQNGFLLWQSPEINDILFTPRAPVLAQDPKSQKFAASATLLRTGTGDLSGGSVQFCVDTAATGDPNHLHALQDLWKSLVTDPANTSVPPPNNPQFRALATKDAVATLDIDPLWGNWADAANMADAGTPGSLLAFSIDLTPDGAKAFADLLSKPGGGAAAPGTLSIKYKYLRILPECKCHVSIHGQKLFQSLSTALDLSVNGMYYGGSAQISAAWQKAKEVGAIEIDWVGGPPPGDLGIDPAKLLNQFIDQALKAFFDRLFKPDPTLTLAKPGSTHGIFGGANFALSWTSYSDAVDMTFDMSFNGETWLNERMDTTLGALFSNLDPSYVIIVDAQTKFYVNATLLPGPHVSAAQLSVTPTVDGAALDQLPPLAVVASSPPAQAEGNFKATNVLTLITETTLKIEYDVTELDALTINDQSVGSPAHLVLKSTGDWLSTMYLSLRVIDAAGHVVRTTDPTDTALDVNGQYGDGTVMQGPDAGPPPPLTTTTPIAVRWRKNPDGTQPSNLTFSAEGVVNGKAVKVENLPLQAGAHSLYYVEGKGLTLNPPSEGIGLAEARTVPLAVRHGSSITSAELSPRALES